MSAAGTYGYFPKVLNPDKEFVQLKSGELQAPFYFGGSQVPEALGMSGSGIHTPYVSHLTHRQYMRPGGKGINTTVHKYSKIYLPKHMKM